MAEQTSSSLRDTYLLGGVQPSSTDGPSGFRRPLEMRPGTKLEGRYEVERVIGEGGMGIVLAARHLQLDQPVAIKCLRPEARADPAMVARFVREARAAVQLRSEHVARVFDVGTTDDGLVFMTMELLDGMDLAAEIEHRGPLPAAEVVEYLLQACDALAEAHALGIVHRDLKPSNLYLLRRPTGPLVKVLDFGISKVTKPGNDGRITEAGVSFGSPVYMSPEQVRAFSDVDARSDIWSLGVVLFELLSGRPPFRADQPAALIAQILIDAPPDLRSRRPDLPAGLDLVALRCLEKDPARRYESVTEFALALAPFARPASLLLVQRIVRTQAAAGLVSESALARMPSAERLVGPNRATSAEPYRNSGLDWELAGNRPHVLLATPSAGANGMMNVTLPTPVADSQRPSFVPLPAPGHYWGGETQPAEGVQPEGRSSHSPSAPASAPTSGPGSGRGGGPSSGLVGPPLTPGHGSGSRGRMGWSESAPPSRHAWPLPAAILLLVASLVAVAFAVSTWRTQAVSVSVAPPTPSSAKVAPTASAIVTPTPASAQVLAPPPNSEPSSEPTAAPTASLALPLDTVATVSLVRRTTSGNRAPAPLPSLARPPVAATAGTISGTGTTTGASNAPTPSPSHPVRAKKNPLDLVIE